MRRLVPWIVPGLTVLMLAGCKTRRYEVLTRITPEGRFQREIVQPLDETLPPEALRAPRARGAATQPARVELDRRWAALWASAQVELGEEGDKERRLRASGDFERVEDIPPSYYAPGVDDRASENLIGHEVEDYGIFAIDAWEEHITETITLIDYVEAVEEALEMLLPSVIATVDELYGERYDVSRLQAFLRGEGAQTMRRYALWYYQYRPKVLADSEGAELAGLQDLLRRIGFELPLDDDGLIDTEALPEVATDFCIDLLQALVRVKGSGQVLTDDEVEELWSEIRSDLGLPPPATAPEDEDQVRIRPTSTETQPADSREHRFAQALGAHFEREHGKQGAEQIQRLHALMGGAHGHSPVSALLAGGLFSESRLFRYVLELPGPILETNGQRIADQAIRWTFSDADLFPDGVQMIARSVRWRRDVEQRLFGRQVLSGIADVARLLDAIDFGGPVHEALVEAARDGSLDAIRELARDEDERIREGARAILDLATPATRPR